MITVLKILLQSNGKGSDTWEQTRSEHSFGLLGKFFQNQSWKEIESWVGCDESGPPGSEDGSEVNAEEKAYRWWQCSALTTLPGCASGINVGWSPSPPHHIVPSSTIISSPSYHFYNSSVPLTLSPNCKHWILIICIFFGNPAYHGIPQQYNTF